MSAVLKYTPKGSLPTKNTQVETSCTSLGNYSMYTSWTSPFSLGMLILYSPFIFWYGNYVVAIGSGTYTNAWMGSELFMDLISSHTPYSHNSVARLANTYLHCICMYIIMQELSLGHNPESFVCRWLRMSLLGLCLASDTPHFHISIVGVYRYIIS